MWTEKKKKKKKKCPYRLSKKLFWLLDKPKELKASFLCLYQEKRKKKRYLKSFHHPIGTIVPFIEYLQKLYLYFRSCQ